MKCIITSGCSFTAGIELDDYYEDKDNGREGSNLIWSYHIKESIWPDAKFINVARSGASNTAIVRRVSHAVYEALQTYSPEDIIVLVMWTGIDRREWRLGTRAEIKEHSEFKYFNSLASDGSLMLKLKNSFFKDFPNPSWEDMRRKNLKDEHLGNIVKEYYSNHVTWVNSVYATLKEIEYLSLYLDKNKIKYYYTTGESQWDQALQSSLNKDMYVNRLIAQNDVNKIIFRHNNLAFCDYARDKKLPFCQYGHPGVEAHRQWAKLMTEWILNDQITR